MSIFSEITRITNARDSSLTSIGNKGVTVPAGSTIDDLPELIDDIDAVKHLQSVPATKDTNVIEVAGDYYAWKDGTGGGEYVGWGGGGSYTIPRGGIRPDAELVKTWTYDKYVVEDEKATIPAYSTTAAVLVPSAEIDTYVVDHTKYSYLVVERILSIPIYKSTYTGGAGKEEYVLSAVDYELLYEPGSAYTTLDGSKSYTSANSAFAGHGQFTRFLYWNKATSVSIYTSAAYGVGHTFAAPTIVANGTMTIKNPPFQIRGHATYMKQEVYEALDDIRNQYVIELWRTPKDPNKVNGWDVYSSFDSILNDIKNNNCKLR